MILGMGTDAQVVLSDDNRLASLWKMETYSGKTVYFVCSRDGMICNTYDYNRAKLVYESI